MPLPQPERHNVKIHRKSYSNIEALIDKGVFVATKQNDAIRGIRATVTYHLSAHAPITLHTDRRISIASTAVNGLFAHLPSPAHTALVDASETYSAYGDLDKLLLLARSGNAAPHDLAKQLEDCVRQGGSRTRTASMTTPSRQFGARWLLNETLLHRTESGDYYLSLGFKSRFRRCGQAPHPCHIGLDVGLDPMLALKHADGRQRIVRPTALRLPQAAALSYKAQALQQDIVYASGRIDSEQVIGYLVHHASRVTAERIRIAGLSTRYVFASRDRATQDFHYSWLPQYLYTARIPFSRVPSGHTSTECPQCQHVARGNRSREHFRCVQCGYQDNAHVVAATNVLHRGMRSVFNG